MNYGLSLLGISLGKQYVISIFFHAKGSLSAAMCVPLKKGTKSFTIKNYIFHLQNKRPGLLDNNE